MEVGLKYIVHIHADDEIYRLVASAKVEHYLHDYAEDYDAAARRGEIDAAEEADAVGFRPYHVGDEVELLVWQKTDLGFKVIVDNRYPALIYEDQIFQYVHTGDRLRGFISRIREDGKLDCSLQPTGKRQTQDFADTLLAYLQAHDGRCPLGDKSDSEDIKRVFHCEQEGLQAGCRRPLQASPRHSRSHVGGAYEVGGCTLLRVGIIALQRTDLCTKGYTLRPS